MFKFEARSVKKHFGGVKALQDAYLETDNTRICGLVGANGSGKSTFSRICAGIILPDEAEIFINSQKVSFKDSAEADEHGVAMVHQNLSLIPDLTVWENIVLGKERNWGKLFIDTRKDRILAEEFLTDLIPEGVPLDIRVSKLTPGQKQMVEIAKAIFRKPRLLILDEPTAALEYKQVEYLFKKIKILKDSGVAIIFISHRLWEIVNICDVVYAFRNGRTVGTVDFSVKPRDQKLIFPLVVGEEGIATEPDNHSTEERVHNEVVVKVEELGLKENVKNVSFQAKRGEILGIGGLGGQGQEELIMLLSGGVRQTEGKIGIKGLKKFKYHGVNEAIRRGVYLVPGDRQKEGLFLQKNILFNVIIPRFSLKKLKVIPGKKKMEDVTEKVIKKAAVQPPDKAMLVKNLSGGNQQKVVFGRWLQFEPEVLLLNDPAKGIDIGAMNYLYKVVHELVEAGTTVILYASSNEELVAHCDRVLIMFEGSIVKELVGDQITDKNLVQYSLRLEEGV